MALRAAQKQQVPRVFRLLAGEEEISSIRRSIDSYLAAFVSEQFSAGRVPAAARPYCDDLAEYVQRPGKRVRPLLFLLACRAFDSSLREFTASHLAAACSLELFHDFVLIHDDVIDGADSRRGRPSLHRSVEKHLQNLRPQTGPSLAVVLGDILFSLAQRCLMEADFVNSREMVMRLSSYVVDTGWGEVLDILGETQDLSAVTLPDVEEMYLLKTTRYTIECPIVLAGMAAGLQEKHFSEIAEIVEPVGLAFQIENDLREFERFAGPGAVESCDLAGGRKTALLRTAFEMLDEQGRRDLQRCLNGDVAAHRAELCGLILRSGAIARLESVAESLFDKASKRAASAELPPEVREGIGELAALVHHLLG